MKTTFRCHYEQFEYRVMFFDFANASATFQIHINSTLKKYLNDFCVCYLNDILIYFQRKENHTNHVRLVLKRLKRHKMFVKFNKCVFHLKEIDYLMSNLIWLIKTKLLIKMYESDIMRLITMRKRLIYRESFRLWSWKLRNIEIMT
jgi:hypothetical protein